MYNIKCDFCGGNHENGCYEIDTFIQEGFQLHKELPPQQSNDRIDILEDKFLHFIPVTQLNFENIDKSIKDLEVQVGKLALRVEKNRSVDISVGRSLELVVVSSINEKKDTRKEVEISKKSSDEKKMKIVQEKSVVQESKILLLEKVEKISLLKNKEEIEEQHALFLYIFRKFHSNNPSEVAWDKLLLCAKFMRFLPKKRTRKEDIFFVSYKPT